MDKPAVPDGREYRVKFLIESRPEGTNEEFTSDDAYLTELMPHARNRAQAWLSIQWTRLNFRAKCTTLFHEEQLRLKQKQVATNAG